MEGGLGERTTSESLLSRFLYKSGYFGIELWTIDLFYLHKEPSPPSLIVYRLFFLFQTTYNY